MRIPATKRLNKPVASWPDYARNRIIVVCDDGQVYGLAVLQDGEALSNIWRTIGPPLPGSARDK